jgi:hypothetical protein
MVAVDEIWLSAGNSVDGFVELCLKKRTNVKEMKINKEHILDQFYDLISSFGGTIKRSRSNEFIIEFNEVTSTLVIFFGEGEHFYINKKKLERGLDWFCYAWNCDEVPVFHFFNMEDVLSILGTRPLSTKSWTEQGYYKWSCATGLPKTRRTLFLERSSENLKTLV